jgi:hypothetical protein
VNLSIESISSTIQGSSFADSKVPDTTAEHFALAKQYQEKADSARKEAADHRKMAEDYKNSVAAAHDKQGQKNPWVVKMEKHCAGIAASAEKLAAEYQKSADFHTLRGKEAQGK